LVLPSSSNFGCNHVFLLVSISSNGFERGERPAEL
jgi:hypothetical protein